MESLAIHVSKKSSKIHSFIQIDENKLVKFCSKKYAKMIIDENNKGNLYSLYYTKTGKLKANIIK